MSIKKHGIYRKDILSKVLKSLEEKWTVHVAELYKFGALLTIHRWGQLGTKSGVLNWLSF